ncbi:aldehyde dehydrogenase family protein [Streptomyces sp. NBC_00391]|uniref:aldehyde dehydrogenase family protein n=1 Tax=Streptomyces sp. NBC_00391 TaxID=2903647 RepID=UPI002E20D88E
MNHANAVACDDRAPFGGFRQSGIGREMGPEGLLSFTEAHTITTHGQERHVRLDPTHFERAGSLAVRHTRDTDTAL